MNFCFVSCVVRYFCCFYMTFFLIQFSLYASEQEAAGHQETCVCFMDIPYVESEYMQTPPSSTVYAPEYFVRKNERILRFKIDKDCPFEKKDLLIDYIESLLPFANKKDEREALAHLIFQICENCGIEELIRMAEVGITVAFPKGDHIAMLKKFNVKNKKSEKNFLQTENSSSIMNNPLRSSFDLQSAGNYMHINSFQQAQAPMNNQSNKNENQDISALTEWERIQLNLNNGKPQFLKNSMPFMQKLKEDFSDYLIENLNKKHHFFFCISIPLTKEEIFEQFIKTANFEKFKNQSRDEEKFINDFKNYIRDMLD